MELLSWSDDRWIKGSYLFVGDWWGSEKGAKEVAHPALKLAGKGEICRKLMAASEI